MLTDSALSTSPNSLFLIFWSCLCTWGKLLITIASKQWQLITCLGNRKLSMSTNPAHWMASFYSVNYTAILFPRWRPRFRAAGFLTTRLSVCRCFRANGNPIWFEYSFGILSKRGWSNILEERQVKVWSDIIVRQVLVFLDWCSGCLDVRAHGLRV